MIAFQSECPGPKPHDRARCDMVTHKWYVPAVGGQEMPWAGTQQQMEACVFDPNAEPYVGIRGTPVCDRSAGRFFYSGDTANPTMYGGQSLKLNKPKPGEPRFATQHTFDGGMSFDRAYANYQMPHMPYIMSTGYVNPALTAMGAGLSRDQIYGATRWFGANAGNPHFLQKPSDSRYAPSSHPDRGSRVNPSRLPVTSPITPTDVNLSNSVYTRRM